jgi:AraC-like DNA-binding protein
MATQQQTSSPVGDVGEGTKPSDPLEQAGRLKKGEVLDQRLAKSLAHPMRISILAVANLRAVSPAEFAREHGIPVQKVSYHFRALEKYGALELVNERPVRGAVEHFYKGTRRAIFGKADWQEIPESVKGGLAGATLQDFVSTTVQAIETGTFQARDDFVFTWEAINLDEKGWKAMVEKMKETWTWIASLEEQAAARLAESGEDPIPVVAAVAGYETPGSG